MTLTFDINVSTGMTNLRIAFNDNEAETGREGKLLALDYLAYSLAPRSELQKQVQNFVNRELKG